MVDAVAEYYYDGRGLGRGIKKRSPTTVLIEPSLLK